jgi:hypothetical protein
MSNIAYMADIKELIKALGDNNTSYSKVIWNRCKVFNY